MHFDPLCDTFDEAELRFVHTLSWGDASEVFKFSPATLRRDMQDYDFVIGNGLTPAFFARMGRKLDIFSPYGSDLYEIPFHSFLRHPRGYFVSRLQRQGILKSGLVHTEQDYFNFGESLERIGRSNGILNLGLAALDTNHYSPETLPRYYSKSRFYERFRAIREESGLMIFHQARHSWKNPSDGITFKGNDRLFKGFARFLKQHPESKAKIVTIEYGEEVQESKALCSELGIADHVIWFPLMARKELMVGLSLSDIGTGEFCISCVGAGVIFEALALAKPILHYRVDESFKHAYKTLYPIMQSPTEEAIFTNLQNYWANPHSFTEMGLSGRRWLVDELNSRVLSAYIEQMKTSERYSQSIL
jgi:hypothetical protein